MSGAPLYATTFQRCVACGTKRHLKNLRFPERAFRVIFVAHPDTTHAALSPCCKEHVRLHVEACCGKWCALAIPCGHADHFDRFVESDICGQCRHAKACCMSMGGAWKVEGRDGKADFGE